MIAVTKINGHWWGGTRYGRHIKYNVIYTGESAAVLDMFEKYGCL